MSSVTLPAVTVLYSAMTQLPHVPVRRFQSRTCALFLTTGRMQGVALHQRIKMAASIEYTIDKAAGADYENSREKERLLQAESDASLQNKENTEDENAEGKLK